MVMMQSISVGAWLLRREGESTMFSWCEDRHASAARHDEDGKGKWSLSRPLPRVFILPYVRSCLK